jgi:hypothetical protein
MKRALLAPLAATLLAAPAYAGVAAPSAPASHDEVVVVIPGFHIAAADETAEAWKRWSEDFSREMRASFGTMFGGRMASGKVVKGAPYSAEIVTETNQPLADGNVISKKTTGHVYRDSAGRTRQESGAPGKERTVFINDAVTGKQIVLNPGTRRAIVNPRAHVFTHDSRNKQVVKVDGTEVRVEDGPQVIVKRIDSGDGTHREEVRVQVVRAGDGFSAPLAPMPPIPPQPPGSVTAPLAPLPPMPGVSTLRFESTARLGKGVTAGLGTKDFDGVKAEGKSTTWTIPAGEIGNRNPINIQSETWWAPELQVTVYSRYADPRTGESIYRLAGIRRGEPAADLFTAPEGYTVKDRAREREEALENARKQREEARERRKPG